MTAYEREMKRIQERLDAMTNEARAAFIERDVATQLEAVQNGDMTEEDYLSYTSQYNSKNTPDDQPVSSEPAYAENLTGGNTADEIEAEAAAKAEAEKLAADQKKKEEEESLLSYQQYIQGIKDNMSAQNSIYTAQTEYWDRQTEEALKALEAQKEAADSYAANLREEAKNAAASQKESIYKDAKETKKNTYASAKEQQEMTYAEAEKERERVAVDAGTSYAQNLAGYGANAEKLAAMGLTTSGASDYANARAYAQNRAEIQGANAKAREEMRYADYEKRQTELGADRDYTNAINNADIDFAKANSNADLTYAQNMYETASGYAKDTLGIRQTGEQGKMEAAITYMNNLGNSDMEKSQKKDTLLQMAASGDASEELIRQLAKNNGFSEAEIEQMAAMAKTAIDTKTNEAKTSQLAALMEAAANGADSQTIAMLGKLYGLDTEQVKQVTDTIEAKEKEAADAAEQAEIDSLGDDYTAADVDDLEISDEKKTELKQAAYDKILNQAKESIKANGGQLGDLTDVDEAFRSGNIDEATYKEIYLNNAQALVKNVKTPEDFAAVDEWLNNWQSDQKLDTNKYGELQNSLYRSIVQNIDTKSYKAVVDKKKLDVTIEIDGNKYYTEYVPASIKNKAVRTMLNTISKKNGNNLAMYDGVLYVKVDVDWHQVIEPVGNTVQPYSNDGRSLYKTYNDRYKNQTRTSSGMSSGMNRTENLAGSGFQQR